MSAPSKPSYEHALKCADYYRDLGWQPLPSKMDLKGPMLRSFVDFWETPLPDLTYAASEWQTTNIQLMTGYRWKLMVVDCDGDEAIETWKRMIAHYGGIPKTWRSRTGGGGEHHYFALPDWLDECLSRRLWGVWDTFAATDPEKPGSPPKGDWQRHKEIRVLGDKALVIAPPSIHVDTGRPYAFEVGPRDLPVPAFAPDWLLKMPAVVRPDCVERFAPIKIPAESAGKRGGRRHDWQDVIAAIPSPVEVAKRWGLRVAGTGPGSKGWWTVHAIDRIDNTPSCQFNDTNGIFWDGRDRTTIPFFKLGVALNAFLTVQDCVNSLGDEFIPG